MKWEKQLKVLVMETTGADAGVAEGVAAEAVTGAAVVAGGGGGAEGVH